MSGAILSLDTSLSNTGWALLAGEELDGGAFELCGGVRQRAHGYLRLWRFLVETHDKTPLAEIVHEDVFSGRKDKDAKRIALFGLVTTIELFGVSRGIPVTPYRSDQWRSTAFNDEERKHFRGKDWKRPAIERARQLGRDPHTDDEAEAFLVLDHHLHCQRIMPPWRTEHPFLETLA